MENICVESVQINADSIVLLQQLSETTFVETFGSQNSPADMQSYLTTYLTYEKLSEEINNPDSAFYFAKNGIKNIGYLKLNFRKAETELYDPIALEIERIYVLNEFHGIKAGQALLNEAILVAQKNHLSYIWLGVWEKNVRAINFYEKNGFVKFKTHIFRLGDDEQTDIMMKLVLS